MNNVKHAKVDVCYSFTFHFAPISFRYEKTQVDDW